MNGLTGCIELSPPDLPENAPRIIDLFSKRLGPLRRIGLSIMLKAAIAG